MAARSVCCGTRNCRNPATYKIASPWSDGRFTELKTYGLACLDHFGEMFREALQRRRDYVPTGDETVGEIGIYRFGGPQGPGLAPTRLEGLEASCRSWQRAELARHGS